MSCWLGTCTSMESTPPALGGVGWQLAHRMADRFERYRQWRPDLLADWAEGAPGEVPDDCDWQRRLWLMVRDRIDGPDPVTRLRELVGVLQESGATAVTREPSLLDPLGSSQLVLRVLRALATHHELFLFCPRPGSGYWITAGGVAPGILNGELPTAEVWQLDMGAAATARRVRSPRRRQCRRLVVEVHACHGRSRQVEVTRDTLLRLFAEDPSLAPHDVVIRAAEPRALAPLVRADFAGGGGRPAIPRHDGGTSGPTERDPHRAGATAGTGGRARRCCRRCEFAALPPSQRRSNWIRRRWNGWSTLRGRRGVRWGFDAAHRRSVGAPAMPQNTWQAGLNRLVAGIALSEDGWPLIGPVLPAGDVEGSGRRDDRALRRVGRTAARRRRVAAGPVPLAEGISVLQRAGGPHRRNAHLAIDGRAGSPGGYSRGRRRGRDGLPEVALSDLRVAVQRRMGERWIAPRLGSGRSPWWHWRPRRRGHPGWSCCSGWTMARSPSDAVRR